VVQREEGGPIVRDQTFFIRAVTKTNIGVQGEKEEPQIKYNKQKKG